MEDFARLIYHYFLILNPITLIFLIVFFWLKNLFLSPRIKMLRYDIMDQNKLKERENEILEKMNKNIEELNKTLNDIKYELRFSKNKNSLFEWIEDN